MMLSINTYAVEGLSDFLRHSPIIFCVLRVAQCAVLYPMFDSLFPNAELRKQAVQADYYKARGLVEWGNHRDSKAIKQKQFIAEYERTLARKEPVS